MTYQTLIKKYKVWEYALFIIGLVLTGSAAYELIMNDYKSMNYVLIELFVGVILMMSPVIIVKFVAKKMGVDVEDTE